MMKQRSDDKGTKGQGNGSNTASDPNHEATSASPIKGASPARKSLPRKSAGETLRADQAVVARNLQNVKHKLLILSGKGGVGKSTIAVQLIRILNRRFGRVGILDLDLCGPTVPQLLGVEGRSVVFSEATDSSVHESGMHDSTASRQSTRRWIPVEVTNVNSSAEKRIQKF